MPDLVDRAREFASEAHRRVGQLRKYSGQPYEEHLRRVAEIVASVDGDAEMLAAAWLHDVVEDTPTTIEEIERAFGPAVRELVDALTDVSRPHDGNRAARKARDRDHLARAPARAQTVKLADLIDNCQDICKHSPRFGRVFLTEMASLLEVLTAGDEALSRRARKTMTTWSDRLACAAPAAGAGQAPGPAALHETGLRRAVRLFARAFHAADVAEALPTLDANSTAAAARELVGCAVFGVRLQGRIAGYAVRTELGEASLSEFMRPLRPSQLLDRNAGLADVVMALTRHDVCFISERGEASAYVSRAEMQGPVARMWLFGMITSLELAITEGIRSREGEVDWKALLSPARLEKAHALQALRAQQGRQASLLDCLQLSDKIRIGLAVDDRAHPLLRGHSKAESQRLARDLEDLRNGLAHAQDIVTRDWAQIARLARRLEEIDRQ